MRLTKKWVAQFIHHTRAYEGIHIPEEKILDYLHGKDNQPHPYIRNTVNAISYVKRKKTNPDTMSICELHGILMGNIDRFAGMFRPFSVMAPTHEPPGPQTVHSYVDRWCQLWGKRPYKSWSQKKAGQYRNYEFMMIYPFSNGVHITAAILHLWDALYHNTTLDLPDHTYKMSIKTYVNETRKTLPEWS